MSDGALSERIDRLEVTVDRLEDKIRELLDVTDLAEHLVFLSYDGADGEAPWYAACDREDGGGGEATTYQEAIRLGGEHAAEHGGRWCEGEPAPEADYYRRWADLR